MCHQIQICNPFGRLQRLSDCILAAWSPSASPWVERRWRIPRGLEALRNHGGQLERSKTNLQKDPCLHTYAVCICTYMRIWIHVDHRYWSNSICTSHATCRVHQSITCMHAKQLDHLRLRSLSNTTCQASSPSLPLNGCHWLHHSSAALPSYVKDRSWHDGFSTIHAPMHSECTGYIRMHDDNVHAPFAWIDA